MAWPLVLMGAGIALQTYGQMKSNQDQSIAEARNAEYYRDQARFAQEAGDREEMLATRQAKQFLGSQVTALAANGIDVGSASAVDLLADTQIQAIQERAAIRAETAFRVNLANLRAADSQATSDALGSPTNQIFTFASGALTGAAQISAMKGKGAADSSGGTKPKAKYSVK